MNNRLSENGHGLLPVSLAGAGRQFVRRLLAVGENRVELLVVEMQEESQRLVFMLFLAIGTAALALLALIGFSAAIVIAFWNHSPVVALVVLSGVYLVAAAVIAWRLSYLLKNLQTLPETLNQLKKDRACLEKRLS